MIFFLLLFFYIFTMFLGFHLNSGSIFFCGLGMLIGALSLVSLTLNLADKVQSTTLLLSAIAVPVISAITAFIGIFTDFQNWNYISVGAFLGSIGVIVSFMFVSEPQDADSYDDMFKADNDLEDFY